MNIPALIEKHHLSSENIIDAATILVLMIVIISDFIDLQLKPSLVAVSLHYDIRHFLSMFNVTTTRHSDHRMLAAVDPEPGNSLNNDTI